MSNFSKGFYFCFLIFTVLLFNCAAAFAQTDSHQGSSSHHGGSGGSHESEGAKFELPVTYVYERSDKEPDNINLNGFVIAPTIKVAPRVGLTGSFSYRRSFGEDREKTSSYEGGGGIDITIAKNHRAKLGLEFEVGGVHERVRLRESEMGKAVNVKSKVAILREGDSKVTETENSAYLFIGGVIDIETPNKYISFRLVKLGYKPTFFGNETQNNFQIETGIIFNFGHK